MTNQQPNIKLSIIMMAYNQGQFIDQAIGSVFKQEMPFEWELVIGDDASEDQTELKVKVWSDLYPDRIRYFKHEQNVGLQKNYIFLIQVCNGAYVALLEADDYWLNPSKNRMQIECMEDNTQLAWTFTDAIQVNENGELIKELYYKHPSCMDLTYFLQNFFNPPNNTIVVRKTCEPIEYPDFFMHIVQWDTVLHYLRTSKGNIGYVPVKGLAWRRHSNATSFSSSYSGIKRYQDWLVINKNITKHLPPIVHKYFKNDHIAYEYIAIEQLRNRKYVQFVYYSLRMLLKKPLRPWREIKDYFWKIRNTNR